MRYGRTLMMAAVGIVVVAVAAGCGPDNSSASSTPQATTVKPVANDKATIRVWTDPHDDTRYVDKVCDGSTLLYISRAYASNTSVAVVANSPECAQFAATPSSSTPPTPR